MKKSCYALLSVLVLLTVPLCSSGSSNSGSSPDPAVITADYTVASESVLRSIPEKYINEARNTLHIAYQHTSHGTHVSYGMFGLPDFQSGDETLFAITNNAETPESGKLDFHDYYGSGEGTLGGTYGPDLSQDNTVDVLIDGVAGFVFATRNYLDNPDNADINVVMWSWCNIASHTVQNYLDGIKMLNAEYGEDGTKIGTGTGKREKSVTFICMTGHANEGANIGDGNPKNQAKLITDFCEANGFYCIDYYSIDTHDMNGNYWEDASDNSYSILYGNGTSENFMLDWQNSHSVGIDWYYNKNTPGGSNQFGDHMSPQYITANRKAYAMWNILARIAGWNGEPE